MYLVCYGTRPEALKLLPLINELRNKCKTFFTGQHPDITYDVIHKPDYALSNIMSHNQTLDILGSKVLTSVSNVISDTIFHTIIVQGDTISAFICALSAFHNKKRIVHIEAGLRTFDKLSPFPEEVYRSLISKLADVHFCPTEISKENLSKENITSNVYVVGNTIVDTFNNTDPKPGKYTNYLLVTLHRRENRGERMLKLWKQLNNISEYNIVYITHPSLPEVHNYLNSNNITLLEPQNYSSMVSLIMNSSGIVTDSGGLQEEAVCARKKVLICRDTTERPETVLSKWGLLVNDNILDNISFLNDKAGGLDKVYGENVSKNIISIMYINV
tara:strand:- start:413 stop:1402 length:990 start_codon:yes stop_codon:yes gene_type:complete